ncbi:MAG: C4-dicarboxylate ABC transporter substrate-binding protein, partial [Lachnospiraceae bacterium]|nr:C4-dicarboxylate ABC transporter substrate-binding protein [Lachnospiraceae bacterium]
MKLSRLIRTSVACAMTLALLVGCSGGGATTAPAAGSTEAASTEAGGESVSGGREGGTALNFTTGGDQGTYYGFGGVVAGKVGETTSTTVTAITSGGSAANIEALQAGDAQIGFAQSDVMAYAYEGTRLFEETGAVTNISTVANLYMEQVQIVTL